MSIKVTNPEGRNVEFKDQRGPTCGLCALSFVLEYLYDIKIPATADGDKTRESLRNKFKKDGRTVIGELYDGELLEKISELDTTFLSSYVSDLKKILENALKKNTLHTWSYDEEEEEFKEIVELILAKIV